MLRSSSGNLRGEKPPRLGNKGSLKNEYRSVKAEKAPILRNVIRQPTCRPIILPKGIPNIIATEDPVTTILKATERNRSGTIRTAIGDTIDQKIACVHATPTRDSTNIVKLVDKKDVT